MKSTPKYNFGDLAKIKNEEVEIIGIWLSKEAYYYKVNSKSFNANIDASWWCETQIS